MQNIYGIVKDKFSLGTIVMTRGASALIHDNNIDASELIRRHASGDWGDVCEDDKKTNDYNCLRNGMVLSCYGEEDRRLWIITDAGHAVTTLLLPEEY